jgi:gliding motility-associated-like protein
VNPNPEAIATADPYLTTLDTPEIAFFNLSESDSTIVNYTWDFGDGSPTVGDENPTHIFQTAGDYDVQLIVVTTNGCESDTTIQVGLTEFVKMFFPNAFSPNGDGLNDVFEIKGTPIADFNLYIYDRWGGQIFSSHDFEVKWEGNNMSGDPVPAGVYLYQVTGSDYLMQPISFKGTVTVVR